MSDDRLFEDDPDLTGPHAVTLEGQQALAVRAMQRAASAMLAEQQHAAEFRRVVREDLKEMRSEINGAAAKLAACPLHEKRLEEIMTKLDGLTRKPTPSEELKAADQRDDATARKVKRWLPILGVVLGSLGIGGGGAALLRERERPKDDAIVKAIQEEQRETREVLRVLARMSMQPKAARPPLRDDKED